MRDLLELYTRGGDRRKSVIELPVWMKSWWEAIERQAMHFLEERVGEAGVLALLLALALVLLLSASAGLASPVKAVHKALMTAVQRI